MGFLSWNTCDTGRSVSNCYSNRGTFTVYMLIPAKFGGGHVREDSYEGYGTFGEKDVYAELASWNVPDECNGRERDDRMRGISIAYDSKHMGMLEYPLKLVEDENAVYENVEGFSTVCEYQGYFYPDDEDDEIWESDE